MAEISDGEDMAQHMMQLQAHLTIQGERKEQLIAKLQSGQAERLIDDLAATRSCDIMDSVQLAMLAEEDAQLAAQESTQVLHGEDGPDCSKRAPAEHLCQEPTVQEPTLTCGNTTPATPGAARAINDHNHCRDRRLKQMEGPADTAKELAKKLTFFTYYELLYLDDDASTEEIHSAYIRRTTEIRSRFRSGIEEWRLTEFLRALHEAHSVLTNNKLRKEYDSRLAAGDWEGTFQDLVSKIPDFNEGAHWSGTTADTISLKDLLLCAGFVTQSELVEFGMSKIDTPLSIKDGPELAQVLADVGLLTFEELASVLLGKALIDRRQITVDQFKLAVVDMREHSHKLVDALINQGCLTLSELNVIGIN